MLSKQPVIQTPLVPQAMFEDEDADDGEDKLGGEVGEDDLDCDVQQSPAGPPEPAAPPGPAGPPEPAAPLGPVTPAKKQLFRKPAAPPKPDVDFTGHLRNMGVPLEALPQRTTAGNKCYTVADDKGKRTQVLHAAKAFCVPDVDVEARGFHVGWKKWGSVAEAWAQATFLACFGSHAADFGCKGVHLKPAAEPAAKPATAAPGSKPPAPQRPAAKPATAAPGSKPPAPQRPAAGVRNRREINPCTTETAD